MDACIMRNHGNFIPRGNIRFEHAVLLLHKHKDDLFLNVVDKYLRYSAHVTVLLSCKIGRNGTYYENNLHAQYFSSRLGESIQIIPSPRAYVERHYTAMYRPSITITDDLESDVFLQKYCPQYYNYASNHFCQLNVSGCIEGLNLAHPIDLSRFDHQLSLFSCNYLRHKICIKTIIQILPPCFIFFTAFGDYKQHHRFQEVINSFILFKYKYDKYFGHEIMLVLGGEFFPLGSVECKNRNYLRSSLENLRKDHNVIFLKKTLNQSEKKTLLRLSYAAVYLNANPDFEDIKFAMSLGTPIICANTGYGATMVNHGTSGFIVEPERIDTIASCMETLSIPTVYHRFSTAARKAYLKNFSETSLFLQTVSVKEIPNFQTPEMPTNSGAPSTLVVNSDFIQSVNNFNIQNDWYVKNEHSADNTHLSVFEENMASTGQENRVEYCEQQIPQKQQFYVNPSIDIYPGIAFDNVPLPRWSEEDEVCDQMYGDHLFETEPVEPVGPVEIKDPSLNEQLNIQNIPYQEELNPGYQLIEPLQSFQLPVTEPYQSSSIEQYQRPPFEVYQPEPVDIYKSLFIDTYQPLFGETYQASPSELYKRPTFQSYQPPLVETNQPSSTELYQHLPFESCIPTSVETNKPPFIETFQRPPGELYQLPSAEQSQRPPTEQYQQSPTGQYQPPPVETNQHPPVGTYQPPLFDIFQSSPVKPFNFSPFKLQQLPSDYSIEPQLAQLYSKETMQSLEPTQLHINQSMHKPNQLPSSEPDRPVEPQMNKSYINETIQTLEPIQLLFNPSMYNSYQLPPVERYQSLPGHPTEPQMTQPYSKETIQSLEPMQPRNYQTMQPFQSMFPHPNHAMQHQQSMKELQNQPLQQLLNQPMQQLQNQPMQQFQNQPMQQLQNQPMQQLQNQPMQQLQNQPMQQLQNQPMQQLQSQLMQQLQNQPVQQLQNQPMQQSQNLSMQQLQKLSMQQLQNLPMQQLQNISMLQFQNQPMQQHPNQGMQPQQTEATQPYQLTQMQPNQSMQLHPNPGIQTYQTMQPNANKTVPSYQSILQQNQSPQPLQPPQVSPNQQSIRPFYVGIMKQYPPQVIQAIPIQNFPRSQLIAPNQPVWYQMGQAPPPIVEPQFSGSEYSTPRQYFEPGEVEVTKYEESNSNDPARRWEEVFAHNSMDECSAHGSELSETREDAWSGICSDDTPSTGNRSWRVFNNSYHSNSQHSDDDWGEANQDSGDEIRGEEKGLQLFDDHEINGSLKVDEATAEVDQESGCKEYHEEQCVNELNAKVDAKLENNQGIDTAFSKPSRSARRKANKRRMKKARPEVSD